MGTHDEKPRENFMHKHLNMFWSACISSLLFASSACACKGPSKTETPQVGGHTSAESSAGFTGEGCMRSGCSGHLCVPAGDAVMSTCIWKDEYACYKSARCEKQTDGKCGWTESNELKSCLGSSATK
jgi:eight-cysteine-cluster-containing protein